MKRDIVEFVPQCLNCQQMRLTKSAHFIPLKITYDAEKLAKVYIREFLPLAEFAYNDSYHLSIDMALFEALYGRRCRSPTGWFDTFEVKPWGTELLRESLEKVKVIQAKLLAAQNRQKEYADRKV
ncbi:uncharacterized protein LOC132048735 [Lycium ferocissimum]|uniref:uncharacterized protein LOC132048735 n=1 Tax=Lycium ferocissimum TaxID=112874 RepID=UPI0028152803|nr:uncharacterized protein LOC132048735 [Lycium ferocissimum]